MEHSLPSYAEEIQPDGEQEHVSEPLPVVESEHQEEIVTEEKAPFSDLTAVELGAEPAVLLFPEHDKLIAGAADYAVIEKFMTYLGNEGIFLAEVAARNERLPGTLRYSRISLDAHIKGYLGIKTIDLANEKQIKLLEEHRAAKN